MIHAPWLVQLFAKVTGSQNKTSGKAIRAARFRINDLAPREDAKNAAKNPAMTKKAGIRNTCRIWWVNATATNSKKLPGS